MRGDPGRGDPSRPSRPTGTQSCYAVDRPRSLSIMFFSLIPPHLAYPAALPGHAYLRRDTWDDWFLFETQFDLLVFDSGGRRHDLGKVKIGERGMQGARSAPQRSPSVPQEFEALGDAFFSLGQDENYYETLAILEPTLRSRILAGLRDVAADLNLFDSIVNEKVSTTSILRYVSPETVRHRFSRILLGDAPLTPYSFAYHLPVGQAAAAPVLEFSVFPGSRPPTNIQVLIGRNGVGKTRCLYRMTRALVVPQVDAIADGSFEMRGDAQSGGIVANVVSVTFSAFDQFGPVSSEMQSTNRVGYHYIGLKTAVLSSANGDETIAVSATKGVDELEADFVSSVVRCRTSARTGRWRRALRVLESDPLFQAADVAALADSADELLPAQAAALYKRLSSGHKIVLLIMSRLVETVNERTLVLLDEPEAHLHPPLLSAFVRSLSDLLMQRNGVAIIATHSPVVLQEAPRSCVWILRRMGAHVSAERPAVETFGENVGTLTREVFGLEVTQAGYHRLLEEAVLRLRDYQAVMAHFRFQLGAEARAIVSAMIADLPNVAPETK